MARHNRLDHSAGRDSTARRRTTRATEPRLHARQLDHDHPDVAVTFRSRLLIAFVLATIIPLAILALGVRRQLTQRLVAQHDQRIESLRQVAGQDVEREARSIASRLATLAATLRADDRFRLAAVRGELSERPYL